MTAAIWIWSFLLFVAGWKFSVFFFFFFFQRKNRYKQPSFRITMSMAHGLGNEPSRPFEHKFEEVVFGLKTPETRSFKPNWFNEYCWLEYSIAQEAAYCFVCRKFSTSAGTFITKGFKNWKNAKGKGAGFDLHAASSVHIQSARDKAESELRIRSSSTIGISLSKQEIKDNRYYLQTVIEVSHALVSFDTLYYYDDSYYLL